MTQIMAKAAELPNRTHFFEVPPHTFLSPCTSDLSARNAGSSFGFRGLDVVATGQVAREDLSTAKEKAPSSKHAHKRRIAAFTTAPYTLPLNKPLGSRSGTASPPGEEPQGPSPMDNDLELEAEFPSDMVAEMQEGAARKARRMALGRTIGGRPTIKVLNDCLKLHLATSFVSATLLTRVFFEALFSNKKGAKTTWKITMVNWSSMSFFFSRYVSNFDASAQGAKALLTHTVKVQFPDLHEQFKNEKALTIMASKIDDVLEIKPADLYVKRHAGPMITMEIQDITRFVGHIRIPSMAERATPKDTILQKILYSSIPNQCRKCRHFGHFARACIVSKAPVWDGSAPMGKLPTWSEKVARGSAPLAPSQTTAPTRNNWKWQGS